MSDTEQGDLLAELRAGGLIDDETDAPQLTTAEPGDTAPEGHEQQEMQATAVDGRIWSGAEQLRPYLVRIEDLKPTEGNPFKGKGHVSRLMGSLVRFGQQRAITIDAADEGRIRAGHHLTLAAEQLGWTHMAAIAAEFNNEGEAIAYLMADNRLARVGDEEVSKEQQMNLLELIGEQNLEGTGWGIDDVETLRAETGQVATVAETEPWEGAAAESGEEAAARAAALAGYEPHKEIPLYMTLPQHERFSEHVRLLQGKWGLKGVMDTILQALEECYNRHAAPVGDTVPDEGATPETPAETATPVSTSISTEVDPEAGVAEPVADTVPQGEIGEAGVPEHVVANPDQPVRLVDTPDDDIPA